MLGVVFALLALAAAAWGAWTYLVPHEVDVPRVVGLSLDQAQAQLDDAGLSAREAKGRYDLEAPVDQVSRSAPRRARPSRRDRRSSSCPRSGRRR